MRGSESGPDSGPDPWDAFDNCQLPLLFSSFYHFFFSFLIVLLGFEARQLCLKILWVSPLPSLAWPILSSTGNG